MDGKSRSVVCPEDDVGELVEECFVWECRDGVDRHSACFAVTANTLVTELAERERGPILARHPANNRVLSWGNSAGDRTEFEIAPATKPTSWPEWINKSASRI